jgi:cytochrome o ubiquinol oxidase operon protein cyoD
MDKPDDYRTELRSYVAGVTLAVLLSAAAFGLVASGTVSRATALWIVAVTAVAQVVVHFRCFLHINLSESKRDDLQLILFSFLIVALMAGGTILILADLKTRMM